MSQILRYGKWFIFFTCSFFNYDLLHGQQGGGVFYHLTAANGLSSDRTTAVIQDREGFYWIATQDGLNRFDGSNCKVFRNIKNDSSSLSHNHCVNLLEDDNGDIWVGTVRGLNRYKKREGKFERFYFHHPEISFDRVNGCKGLTKDNAGNIWFSSYGLWRFNITSGEWKQFLHDSTNSTSIPSGIIACLAYDPEKNGLWMSGMESYIFLSLDQETFYHKDNNTRKLIIFTLKSYASSFAIDKERNIWLANHDESRLVRYSIKENKLQYARYKNSRGIFRLSTDDKGRVWTHFWSGGTSVYDINSNKLDTAWLDYFHPQSALTGNSNNLYIDKTGNYWFTSFKGISIFNPEAQSVKYYSIPGNKKNHEGTEIAISCIAEQNESILWLGTSGGLYRYDVKKNELKQIHEIKVHNNLVKSVYLQGDSVLWIGGHGELIRYDIIHKRLLQKIPMPSICWSIKEDEGQNIWVVTWSNGVFQFSSSGNLIRRIQRGGDPAHGLFYDRTLSLFIDKQPGVLWIGYNGGAGFSKISNRYTGYEHFKIHFSSPQSGSFNTVNCIQKDKTGNLWMGTYGGGLVFYDTQKKEFSDYTQSDGLKGNFINSLLIDDSSRIWISTSNGLNILDTKSNLIIGTDIDLRFPSDDLVPNAIVRKNKRFLFFSGRIVVDVDPFVFLKPPVPPTLLVGTFKIFNEEVSLPVSDAAKKTLSLSHRQNYFSFDYSLLKPNPNAPVQYAYQLEGFDKDWNYIKERRTAFFTNVPAGSYVFRVKAMDNAGKWSYFSKPVFIQIVPPFWQQWWFYISCAAVITAILLAFYHDRVNHLKKILTLRTKISRDLHDEVGATLSGIKVFSSLAKDRPETGKSYLDKINMYCDEMLEKMSDIVWTINPKNDNFERIISKLYNYAESVTSAKNIELSFNMDENLQNRIVKMIVKKDIYLIAKEAINNAVKYSVCKKISVSLTVNHKTGLLKITDDGMGFNIMQSNNGNGLKNIYDRAAEIDGKVTITSSAEKGTTLELTFNFT